jgi:methionine aminopeptidase
MWICQAGKLIDTSDNFLHQLECLKGALDIVKPGTLYRDHGTVIQKIATSNGCSVNCTYCGRSVGKLFQR